MTDEIINLTNYRRTHKNRSSKTYKKINKEIRMKSKKAKEKWINKQCEELEDLEKRDIQMMYNKIELIHQSCPSANTAQ